MEAIYIPRLTTAPERTEVVQVDEYLPDLETLTPIHGQIKVIHRGKYLEVSARAEAIVTLTCHRCLQQYNYRLAIAPSELIWLDEAANQSDSEPLEREVALEDLVETLHPQGYFHLDEWLYQQLCLEMPPRQLCDQQCSGIQVSDNSQAEPVIDRRWASLEALKKQLS